MGDAETKARKHRPVARGGPYFGALDLGTNNCRLLVAERLPSSPAGFQVVDSFSRITRLGKGLSSHGVFDQDSVSRTLAALRVCANKLERWDVAAYRLVATEACRQAKDFLIFRERVEREARLHIEVISPEKEAGYALAGCAPLFGSDKRYGLLIDIGGGSTELVFVALSDDGPETLETASIPCGVVVMADRFPGDHGQPGLYAAVLDDVHRAVVDLPFLRKVRDLAATDDVRFVGASGTVTTLAGVHLGLSHYDRSRVDGTWIDAADAERVTRHLCDLSLDERARIGCVGAGRADLVVAGCAILEALIAAFGISGMRVADRGVREGILQELMTADRSRAAE